MAGDPALREAAIRLLARREHGRAELAGKLARKGWPPEDIEPVIDGLADEGLQCDVRFAEGFVRSRVGRFWGPLRIRAELGRRGIDGQAARQALEGCEADWSALAGDWYGRRYQDPPEDAREKSRRMQALSRRGFTSEHFRWIFE